MSALYDRLVTVLGDLKLFRYPCWLVYDPGSYKVRGPEIRELLGKLRPGDVLLRRYDDYLDGRLIPGTFSHAALYLGEVGGADEARVPQPGRSARYFVPGPQQVSHSTAEGVHLEDVLTFFQNDGMALLRLPGTLRRRAHLPPRPVDILSWHPREREIHARLCAWESVPREEVLPLVRDLALGLLGTAYDFAFDFEDGHRLSCSEYVATTFRCLAPALDLAPSSKGWLQHLLRKRVFEPDALLGCGLETVHVTADAAERLRRRGASAVASLQGRS